jgi:hypothetical protein
MADITNWTDTGAATTTTVAIPKFGGIMLLGEDGLLFPWSGNDPDSETQCFSYNESKNSWTYTGTYDANKPRHKGAEHIGMYRMPSFKYSTKIKDNCTTFTGTSPYNGSTPKEDSPTMTLSNYKQSTRRHMIINGLFDNFVIVNTDGQEFDLFSSHSLFLEDDIKAHVNTLRATGCLLVIENLTLANNLLMNQICPPHAWSVP